MTSGKFNASPATLADGEHTELQLDSTGNLRTTASGGATAAGQTSQSTLIGAVTETAPATDTASSGLNGRLQRIAQRLTSLLPVGSQAAAASLGVTASTEDIARQGIITETAPASDTASSGQNGRLQRIAQNITAQTAMLTVPFPLATTPWTYAAAASGIVNTTTGVTAKTSAGGSLRNYVSSMQIMWEALTNATELVLNDGAAGTVLWRMKIPASLAGTRDIIFPVPLKGTAATLLELKTLSASGAGAVYWNLQGFAAL